ncbi:Membrane protein involved in the export of O-antigen, teichoic acid lipoteichoic acids [Methanosarcina sp. MTP4]|uniref:oligosaccharide flippase family protein n=1 Tax=Methanosarcina sp. MTP4 TaxID=1434100 RepID=UPI000615F9BC|nr:oligosaccharide flippase family protein [Methanosarcina sp. MTP4]AKB24328.1 Membrane protein involved in the export of O-antigen, teichoic acid lipoteichoic acids [Methanosarcina sp. MTP4]
MINSLIKNLKQSNSFLSFTSLSALAQGIGFILPLIIAKILSPEGFGSYSLSMMIVFFFTTAIVSSSQTPFIVYSNEELKKNNKINKAFTAQLMMFLSSILIFAFLLLAFSNPIAKFAQISFNQLILLYFAFLGIGSRELFKNLFLALDKKIFNALYILIVGIINIIFLGIYHQLNFLNLNSIFIIYFLSPLISIIFLAHKIEFKKISSFSYDNEIFKRMITWTTWQIFGLTAVYLINWGDNLILRYFVSLSEIGIYNLGYQIFKGLISLTFILNSYFLPYITKNINNERKIQNYLYVKRPKIMLAGTFGIIIIFLLIPYVFGYIYGDIYKESVTIVRILLIGAIIALYNVFYTPILNSLKMYKFYQISNIIHVLINILLNIIFIQIIGIYGAAVATVIAYFCKTVMFELYIYKKVQHYSIFSRLKKQI